MSTPPAALDELDSSVAELVRELLSGDDVSRLSDSVLLEVAGTTAGVVRRLEALLVEIAGEVVHRSAAAVRDERLSARLGCHNVSELLQRATRLAPRSVGELLRGAKAVRRETSVTTGELLPARLPSVREALLDGTLGVDGLLAVADPLASMMARVDVESVLLADGALAEIARGESSHAAPPACAADLRMHAHVFTTLLDQDGAEPREAIALRKRGIRFGETVDGLVKVNGALLPEVFAQFQRIADAVLNPKSDGPAHPAGPRFAPAAHSAGATLLATTADPRSRAQQLHDVLATALSVAARSGELPTIGGSAPTLIVSVRHEDLAEGRGFAHVDGTDEPVSVRAAEHVACTGSTQRVLLDAVGRITAIHTIDRVFNHHQRRAIALRDGGCVIPGCHVTAGWCEIHHVTEHAQGGETHTDNGVLLCWTHHRTLATSGWDVRMRLGSPEVRGPAWWDAARRWRRTTTSPTRLLDQLLA